MASDSEHGNGGDTFATLADIAAEANIVEAVHSLPGGSTFAAAVQRMSADYWETHDDDSGYGAWMQARWPEAQRAWAADVATVAGDAVEPPDRVAPDATAILNAAAAWKRGEADDEQMKVLFDAVTQMRGRFMQRVEREAASAMRAREDVNERLAQHRDEMRALFRADLAAIIKGAGG
jgi:hypothetical protein